MSLYLGENLISGRVQNEVIAPALFSIVPMDHVLSFTESKGYAPLGTYVYKEAVAGSRYGYGDFYAKCLEEKEAGEEVTATIADVEVTTYVNANGHVYYDIADKEAFDILYGSLGIAWYYGIDTVNERVFLPRNDWFFQGGNVDSVGSFNEAGLPNIEGEITRGTYTSLGFYATGSGALSVTPVEKTTGISTTSTVTAASKFKLDASLSDSIYGNSDTVQPASVNTIYYMVVGNTVSESAVTDVVDITAAENDTLPLLHHIAADEILNHPAWLRSSGQWNDGNIYTTVYNYLVNEYTNGTSHTDTITTPDGTAYTVDYKTVNGKKVVDYSNVEQVDNLYNAIGSAWYYVINQEDMTFRLPQSKNYECYTSDSSRLGLDVSAGLPNLTGSFRSDGKTYYSGMAYYADDITGEGLSWSSSGSDALVRLDASLSNPIYGNSDTVTPAHTEFYLYFKISNAVQNLELLDVGKVMEEAVLRSNCDECEVVIETYRNGSSWYRIWSDGWCEQGGYSAGTGSWGTATITLLKPYADTTYNILVNRYAASSIFTSSSNESARGSSANGAVVENSQTTTDFKIQSYGKMTWTTRGYLY